MNTKKKHCERKLQSCNLQKTSFAPHLENAILGKINWDVFFYKTNKGKSDKVNKSETNRREKGRKRSKKKKIETHSRRKAGNHFAT
jgi:hypothetical protein